MSDLFSQIFKCCLVWSFCVCVCVCVCEGVHLCFLFFTRNTRQFQRDQYLNPCPFNTDHLYNFECSWRLICLCPKVISRIVCLGCEPGLNLVYAHTRHRGAGPQDAAWAQRCLCSTPFRLQHSQKCQGDRQTKLVEELRSQPVTGRMP